MSSTRPRRSNAASASAPPTGPCLLHRLPAELVKNIVELSIEEEDLAPYPHQQRTFELAGQVCRLWHDLLAHPQAYVVTDVLMAQRLAEKFKRDGTGRSVRKLGIDYSGQVWVKGRAVPPVPAIAMLLDECPRLLELILIGNHLGECPSLTHLDTGRLTFVEQVDDPAPTATALGLVNLDTCVTSQSLSLVSSAILTSIPTLTTLHLGTFYQHYLDIAKVVAAIAPVAPNLVDFEWSPHIYWNPQLGPRYPGLHTLASMTHLRILETGSRSLTQMIPQDALLALPSVECLILNMGIALFGSSYSASAVVAFLTSPASRGLKYFRLRMDQTDERSWAKTAREATNVSIVQQTRGTGIEVVLD
ncbi:hypothetical protein RQP46_002945 [Phenoliferia psychrophenolica]